MTQPKLALRTRKNTHIVEIYLRHVGAHIITRYGTAEAKVLLARVTMLSTSFNSGPWWYASYTTSITHLPIFKILQEGPILFSTPDGWMLQTSNPVDDLELPQLHVTSLQRAQMLGTYQPIPGACWDRWEKITTNLKILIGFIRLLSWLRYVSEDAIWSVRWRSNGSLFHSISLRIVVQRQFYSIPVHVTNSESNSILYAKMCVGFTIYTTKFSTYPLAPRTPAIFHTRQARLLEASAAMSPLLC